MSVESGRDVLLELVTWVSINMSLHNTVSATY